MLRYQSLAGWRCGLSLGCLNEALFGKRSALEAQHRLNIDRASELRLVPEQADPGNVSIAYVGAHVRPAYYYEVAWKERPDELIIRQLMWSANVHMCALHSHPIHEMIEVVGGSACQASHALSTYAQIPNDQALPSPAFLDNPLT